MSATNQPHVMAPAALPGLREAWTALRGTAAGLIIGVLILGGLFHAEVAAAVFTWIDSTAYNHCFLVIPIAAFLIWDRRGALRGLVATPVPLIALAGLPLALAWLFAERLGIMEGRQLVAVTFLELLFLGVFGWRLWWALSGPLLYLYFLVPFGEFLTPKLQDITTVFVRYGLEIAGIPAYIDGYVIEIPEGVFFVAQACAGLRFLIASIAFGALYALMMYRSPIRRAAFILISIVVPIVANGFRALGIVSLGHILGSAEAASVDHVLYGWIFFSLVILLLVACGLPFREDLKPDVPAPGAAPAPGSRSLAGAFACGILIAVAAVSPAIAAFLNHSANRTLPQPAAIDPGTGCISEPGTPPVRARAAAGGRAVDQHIKCGEVAFDLHISAFSSRSTAGPVMAERNRLIRPAEIEETSERWLDQDRHVWRIVVGNEQPFVMAVGVWVNGEPTLAGLALRARMAWTSVTGARFAPIVVTITPAIDWARLPFGARQRLEKALTDFLLSHPELPDQINKLADVAG